MSACCYFMKNKSLNCVHKVIECLNPYELIRKYRCSDCGAVMMCACDEKFALRFLPHQIREGSELDSGIRILVTAGFIKQTCNACKGIAEKAHPKAQIYGCTSKIVRYYWREIQMGTITRFGEWAEKNGCNDWLVASRKYKEKYSEVRKEVVEELKRSHASNPKYTYCEESEAVILAKHKIEVVSLCGDYEHKDDKCLLRYKDELISPEEFVAKYYRERGYQVILTESRPFHVLFATFMWLLIEDHADPLCRTVGFGDRVAFENKVPGQQIWMSLPEDFGKKGYFVRRSEAIVKHFKMLVPVKKELLWLFDYWVDASCRLRQYLWAHRPEDAAIARQILQVLPPQTLIKILDYLLKDYWGNYCGWPDLLIYNGSEFFFAEVKSSKDKLRENQKNWIRNNSKDLQLPFKMVKIHRC